MNIHYIQRNLHIRNLYIRNLYTSMYIQCTYYDTFVTYTFVTDDAFFNWNWAGVCGGRWAGPGLLAGWAVGS